MATCPECDAEIVVDGDDFEEMEVGDPWNCDACGSSLRVASLVPIEFDDDEDDDEEDEEKEKEDEEKADDDAEDDDDDDDEDDEDADGGGDRDE